MKETQIKESSVSTSDNESMLPDSTVNRNTRRRRLRGTHVVNVFSLSSFIVLALSAHSIPFFGWDLKLAHALQMISILRLPMQAISLFGNGLTPHVLTAITALLFLIFYLRAEGFALVFSAGGSAAINTLIKQIVARPRPTNQFVTILQEPGGLSFPSGHVTFYVCYFGFLFFLAYILLPKTPKLRAFILVLTALPILLIGVSRVYLGAHWPSDTIGSYLWSGVWLTLSISLYRRLKTVKQ
jgi:undecaprenyl-diphosphatase